MKDPATVHPPLNIRPVDLNTDEAHSHSIDLTVSQLHVFSFVLLRHSPRQVLISWP